MKNVLFLASVLTFSATLSGCTIFKDDGKWKEKYGTPELLLSQVGIQGDTHIEDVYLYNNELGSKDTNYEIKDAILAVSPFEKIKKRKISSQRFFTYQAYWQPATSGPNYCSLKVYDDGLMIIIHKKSLGPYGFLYFEMDSNEAANVVDFVFTKLSITE